MVAQQQKGSTKDNEVVDVFILLSDKEWPSGLGALAEPPVACFTAFLLAELIQAVFLPGWP
jgi:hypothetical protein